MPKKIFSATPFGLDAKIVEVEVDVSNGLPATIIVGLADTSIKESKERVRSCLRSASKFKYPLARVTINLAPADLYKYGTQMDFAIALGILSASGQIEFKFEDSIFLGELSLDGTLRKIKSCLAMVLEAKAKGFCRVFLSEENYLEASLIQGMQIIPLKKLDDFFEIVENKFLPVQRSVPEMKFVRKSEVDFSEIQGHAFAKRALEIAASGNHNILMSGSPGVGKSLLAKALNSIVPDPPQQQIIETVKIYSSLGLVKETLNVAPFRNPHHSITMLAFTGGGVLPRPGELSLAHNGVLFLDEFPEFDRSIIESLRQPLEEGYIQISRLNGNYIFPAKFIFIAAQNPCPCGYFGDASRECNCNPWQIQRYQKKISGPILDRIDIQIYIEKTKFKNLNSGAENSAEVMRRVAAAREIQYRCRAKLNSSLNFSEVRKFCFLNAGCARILDAAAAKFNFSNRTYLRILKVARTIADLDKSENINEQHLAEAIHYRISE